MTKRNNTKIGQRDIEILAAIDRCPLTVAQLCELSETFVARLTNAENLRRRLRQLAEAGFIRKFEYSIASRGASPHYFKLTPPGYRLLYGADSALPKRGYFAEIRPGHHHHTNCLAQTIVKLCVSAAHNNCRILHFARENSVRLEAEPFTVYPDCAFVVRSRDGRKFPFVVEFDAGTERVRSKQDVESVERKLRGYDAHQSQFDKFHPDRYLVLFITTRSELRLRYILDVAGQIMRQPQRRVFLGVELNQFLNSDPFQDAIFEDHRGLRRTLVPSNQLDKSLKPKRSKSGRSVPSIQRSVVS
jgi:hypothetical protein